MTFPLPPVLLARMAGLLGDEYEAFRASLDAAPITGLRVNTLKISPEAFRALSPFDLEPLPWPEGAFRVAEEAQPGKHPYHAAGLYYLQDPSAMAVAELLDPQPGERVLDLAAAPGGKATQIAALMGDTGLLVANEVNSPRAWELAGNLERWGVRAAAITVETPERLAERLPGFFDRVLVDAPCSGEGMMRKSEAARREWAPELVRGCALRQSGILEHAARLVRPGGRLAYSTCTFNPEENEGTVARFLDAHPEFKLMEPQTWPGFSPGRPDWIAVGAGPAPPAWPAQPPAQPVRGSGQAARRASLGPVSDRAPSLDLARAVRIWPHLYSGEGHFAALLRKRESDLPPPPRPWRPGRLPRPAEGAYRDFCATNLAAEPAAARLALVGSYLYALPEGLPDLTGLRFLHPGWWLGVVKGDRFEPSHALAMGLRAGDARRVLALRSSAPELLAYLQGRSQPIPGEEGWVLVAVDDYPLGWAKRVQDIVKSHYPKGLRRG